MLLFLAEKLYDYVKDDEEYHKMADKYTESIFYNNDFLSIIREYNKDNPCLIEMCDYLRTHLPEEKQLELDVVLAEDPKEYEEYFDQMDIETKIFYLYAYNNGDMAWNQEAEERNKLCIQLYEENILDKPVDCSLFIHTIYYMRKVYELVWKYTNRKRNIKEFENFKQEEYEIFDQMISISDNESFIHIMYSKREQMYGLYLEFVGQFIEDRETIFRKIWEVVNNSEFKYNYFSFYKLNYYLICFQQYMDSCDIDNAKQCLDKLIELINYAYDNKIDAIDSLNHYNKGFIDDFMVLSKFIYFMVSKYMPNLNTKWNFLKNSNMKPAEYRYYKNTLNNKDKEIVKEFNVNDRNFSYSWLPSNEILLTKMDQKYLDN